MATALTGVLTRPVAQIVAGFMEFAPGVPDSDALLTAMMLKIRKKFVDEGDYMFCHTKVSEFVRGTSSGLMFQSLTPSTKSVTMICRFPWKAKRSAAG